MLMQTKYLKNLILIIWVNTMTCMLEVIRCYLRILFRQYCLENYELDPAHFVS